MNDDSGPAPALILDLDGTLVDSVYQHILAWCRAFTDVEIPTSAWNVHRRIGMSGNQLVETTAREAGTSLNDLESRRAIDLHGKYYAEMIETVSPLPGALELIQYVNDFKVKCAIATSGGATDAEPMLRVLGLAPDEIPLITSAEVGQAKPNPELLLEAVEHLDVNPTDTLVVGDSIWDMLAAKRAGCIGVGVMSGGLGKSELLEAQAFRVYSDVAQLLRQLDGIGLQQVRAGSQSTSKQGSPEHEYRLDPVRSAH